MAECGRFKLHVPFTMLVCGGTGTGKTEWLCKLIDNANGLFDKPLKKVIWCYGISTRRHAQLALDNRFILNEGLPDTTLIDEVVAMEGDGCLLVLDDLAAELKKAPELFANLYSRISHHRCISVVSILQNLFSVPRTARLNSSYLCILKTTSDMNFLFSLGRQLFEKEQYKSFIEAYKDATKNPFGYLFLDLHTRSDDNCRLLTDIFSRNLTVYVPKKR
ncbi:hypothetical protein PRIPAC_86722 [Pristionchus pacificus]|uniref:Uncharacterized protein n=1 Tax=Pristionchus pacificus TaxID=54126 RepID=A0A2A6CEC0_PRIPA|nr:hypothetical protein PRIPAC_86722 [Pristionchus pacificus]|eukprot:PDM76544.1 hypothetical protein PRIPAC_42910 [Pristionchus pacificus]